MSLPGPIFSNLRTNRNPYGERRYSIAGWRGRAVLCCVENEEIVSFAEKLRKLGVKTKDALHIACAFFARCDYFITTDKRLLSISIKEIRVVSPLAFIEEQEG